MHDHEKKNTTVKGKSSALVNLIDKDKMKIKDNLDYKTKVRDLYANSKLVNQNTESNLIITSVTNLNVIKSNAINVERLNCEDYNIKKVKLVNDSIDVDRFETYKDFIRLDEYKERYKNHDPSMPK